MDADDISYTDRIAEQVKFLECNPDVSVCGANFDLIDGDGNQIQQTNMPTSNKEIRRLLYFQNPICHPTVMYRRKDVILVGGYASKYAEDYDLWIRLLGCPGIIFANLPKVLVGYRTPVVSQARRSKRAYVEISGAQLRCFILTLNPKWIAGSVLSALKAWFRARKY
jgi:hypothetical protein